MATGFFHHLGTFLLLSATVLLIITCISAPVVHDIALLKVDLGQDKSRGTVSFGTFGYCQNIDNAPYVFFLFPSCHNNKKHSKHTNPPTQ